MPNLIDTHFHLDHYVNYSEIAEMISELKQYTICVTNSPGVFVSCRSIITETKYLKFAVGFHPLEPNLSLLDLELFQKEIDRTKYVGEIGLDFSRKATMGKPAQLYAFESILEQCAFHNKLMTIHLRGAEDDAIKLIKRYNPKKSIIHWFSGKEAQMRELIDLGCFFSVNLRMVEQWAGMKHKRIPLNRILVESDGPYTQVLGQRYYPKLLQSAYNRMANLLGIENFESIVFANFRTILEM